MQNKQNEYDLINDQIIQHLHKDIGIEKYDVVFVADKLITWLQENKREETKTVEPKGWLVIAKIKAQHLSLVIAESTKIITGTSVVQPNAKTFSVNISLEN